MVTLINCYQKLVELGIDMNAIGSGDLFSKALLDVFPEHYVWEYDFASDRLLITIAEDEVAPDLSMFGEVLPNAYTMG
jgi:hypothetical protein